MGINNLKKYTLPLAVFIFTLSILSVVQIRLSSHPMILLERFIKGGGWFEIVIIAFFAGFVTVKMQNPLNIPKWRRITWTLFSFVFFIQLIIGLSGAEKFLMTGKLHLPVPVMILAGPLYRGQLSVMTILFLSTIVLTGPAWCSQLCYFGAIDSIAAKGKTQKRVFENKKSIKTSLILLVITGTLLLRWMKIPILLSTIIAVSFGLTGIAIMMLFSRKNGKMVHCILYCPIGTIVNILKPVNPFRLFIDNSCTLCMKCTSYCKYDALNIQDIKNKKPDFTCTLCGDCLASCHTNSIKYRYFKLKPETAHNLYLFLTISLYAVFLAVARI